MRVMAKSLDSSNLEENNKIITAGEAAARLGTAISTLNSWLADDGSRGPTERMFDFHRWRGNKRVWSEEGFQKLEMAIHRESENGILAGGRTRQRTRHESPPDPDAKAALEDVLGAKRTY
jgi:hypothetical protein